VPILLTVPLPRIATPKSPCAPFEASIVAKLLIWAV